MIGCLGRIFVGILALGLVGCIIFVFGFVSTLNEIKKTSKEIEYKKVLKTKELASTVTAEFQWIDFSDHDINKEPPKYSANFDVKVKFTNKAAKPIKAFKGTLTLFTVLDDQIKAFEIDVTDLDKPLKPSRFITKTFSFDYNQFFDEDVKLKSLCDSELKYTWSPTVILYSDGTTERAEGN